jgi:hypothetical protein
MTELKTFGVVYVEETSHRLIIKAKDETEAEKIAEAIYYGNEDEITDAEALQYVKTITKPQDNNFCYSEEVNDADI